MHVSIPTQYPVSNDDVTVYELDDYHAYIYKYKTAIAPFTAEITISTKEA